MAVLPPFILCLVTSIGLVGSESRLLRLVDEAVEGGVNMVQLREKGLSNKNQYSLAQRLREITVGRALLIANATCRGALDADVDGIHYPDGFEPSELYRYSTDKCIVGRSVHSPLDVSTRRADYVFLGPIFKTTSHPNTQPIGVKALSSALSTSQHPAIVAIGGINSDNVKKVYDTGARGIAVISSISSANKPFDATRSLLAAVN